MISRVFTLIISLSFPISSAKAFLSTFSESTPKREAVRRIRLRSILFCSPLRSSVIADKCRWIVARFVMAALVETERFSSLTGKPVSDPIFLRISCLEV